jgi:hypothetical protein
LNKLVAFNTIVFSDEKDTKTWMCGFYIGNIQYRLWHLHDAFRSELDSETVEALSTFVNDWSPWEFTPEEATLPTFDERGPFKTKAFFNETLSALKMIIECLRVLATN